MPELPDITVYLECLAPRVLGQPLERLVIRNPFVLRTVSPSPADVAGARVTGLRRLGKRIVLALDGERFLVIHLMIAGRLRWHPADGKPPGKIALARSSSPRARWSSPRPARSGGPRFISSTARRISSRSGGAGWRCSRPSEAQFAERLRSESHTLKRALTDPRLFSGIGNAYSDEILHRARLSPLALTRKLDDEAVEPAVRRDPRDPARTGPSGFAPRWATASPTR